MGKPSSTQSNEQSHVPSVVHEVLGSPGHPLDHGTRAVMEQRFGADFSRVRLHTGDKANESAQAIDSRAFTFGSHIVFGNDTPERSPSGLQLLAHELTHVVQQAGAQHARPIGIAPPSTVAERQAESVEQTLAVRNEPKQLTHQSLIHQQSPFVQRSMLGGIVGGVVGGALLGLAGLAFGPVGAVVGGILGGLVGMKIGDMLSTPSGVTTVGCDENATKTIMQAHDNAKLMLRVAIQKLTADPVSAVDQTQFANHFGSFTEWRRDQVVSVLRGALHRFTNPSMRYECEAECSGTKMGYTLIIGNVHLCPPWFAERNINEQSETMIHENLHHDALMLDLGYHRNKARADQSLIAALLNADAYSECVQDLNE